jgi:hypothetical protein
MLGEYRIAENIRSRRNKNNRPTKLKVRFRRVGGEIVESEKPISEYPATVAMPQFPMPTIFNTGLSPVDPNAYWINTKVCTWVARDKFFTLNADVEVVYNKFWYSEENFARFLAKIALGFAYSFRGKIDFEPLLPDLILGRSKNFAYLIGSEYILANSKNVHHDLKIFRKYIDGSFYFCVRVIILHKIGYQNVANSSAPIYWIVVGKEK